jgi:hypothetical protein
MHPFSRKRPKTIQNRAFSESVVDIVHHRVDVRQDGRAADDRDDAPAGGRDVRDQERLFEDVTKVLEPNEGSTRPKRSPKPNPKYSSDDYDLNYAGSKSWTTSRRSIRRAGHLSR